MNLLRFSACAALLGGMMIGPAAAVSTPGSLSLNATVSNYTGSSSNKHWTVVWVTNTTTGLVRTIRRQGPGYASHWNSHCSTWYAAVAANSTNYTVATDGYTSTTAADYTANSGTVSGGGTFVQTWNCKDASGVTVPDGTYNIYIQYAEDSGQGPVTAALSWTKGPTPNNPVATPFANQVQTGSPTNTYNFTGLSATWTPEVPEIAVEQPAGTNLTDGSASIACGNVNLGSSSGAVTFTVKNSGTAALTLTNPVTKDGTNASDFTVSSIAASVAAAGSTTFTVTFTPGAVGARTAAIHIASNDANENPFDINLTGTGVGLPEIAVEQPAGTNLVDGSATMNYGIVSLGSNLVKTFTVKNTGTAALTLTTPAGKDGTNAADFAVSSLATSVAAGGSTTFTVTFTPGAAGTRTAAIHLANTDSDENPFDINLSGTGNTPPVYSGYSATTSYQTAATVALRKILTKTSDADGDTTTISAAGPSSANGGAVVLQSAAILYTPANGFSGTDTFPVTIADARGATIPGSVTVVVGPAPTAGGATANPPKLTSLPGGGISLKFQGIPGQSYQIQRSTDLATWTTISSGAADSVGTLTFIDSNPPQPSGYYRLALP